jgi:hypothetical protein
MNNFESLSVPQCPKCLSGKQLKKMKRIIEFVFVISLFTSCSVLDQTSQMKAFGRCDFRIESSRNMKLAGVNIQGRDATGDLSLYEMAKIGSVIAGGTLPLTFDLNIEVKNPNATLAAMNKMDWILLIDDAEVTRGVLAQRIEVPAYSMANFPVFINIDLLKSINGKSSDALINLALTLSGTSSRPTRIKLKAKPTIYFGTTPVEYPGYITIRQDFGSD